MFITLLDAEQVQASETACKLPLTLAGVGAVHGVEEAGAGGADVGVALPPAAQQQQAAGLCEVTCFCLRAAPAWGGCVGVNKVTAKSMSESLPSKASSPGLSCLLLLLCGAAGCCRLLCSPQQMWLLKGAHGVAALA